MQFIGKNLHPVFDAFNDCKFWIHQKNFKPIEFFSPVKTEFKVRLESLLRVYVTSRVNNIKLETRTKTNYLKFFCCVTNGNGI